MTLDTGSLLQFENVLVNLEELCIEYPDNAELLWRIGKVLHKMGDEVEDKNVRKSYITKGNYNIHFM